MMKKKDEDETEALDRVEQSKEAIKWLMEFTRIDLNRLPKGRRQNFIEETRVFCLYGSVGYLKSRGTLPLSGKYQNKLNKDIDTTLASLLPHQNRIRKFLLAITQNKPKFSPKISITVQLSLDQDAKKEWHFGILGKDANDRENWENAFLYHSFFLLGQFGSLIRTCGSCEKYFLANRTKQQFCSSRCLGRETQRRFRKKRQE